MFSWLQKCFGYKREDASNLELTAKPEKQQTQIPTGNTIPQIVTNFNDCESQKLPDELRDNTLENSLKEGASRGRSRVQSPCSHPLAVSPAFLGNVPLQNEAFARPADFKHQAYQRAAEATTSGRRKRSHPESPVMARNSYPPSVEGREGSANKMSRTTLGEWAARPGTRPNREEQPLQVCSTPFHVRVERQLQQYARSTPQELGGLSCNVFSSPSQTDLSPAELAPRRNTSPRRSSSAKSLPYSPKSRSLSPRRHPVIEEGKSGTFGNENTAPNSLAGKSSDTVLGEPAATPANVPSLKIQLPALLQLATSNPQTPGSPQNVRFVVDKEDSFGPAHIAGVENSHTLYREDKRLRVHETPFEVRVERFMHREQEFKEKFLDKDGTALPVA